MTEDNAHPHFDSTRQIGVVHNGVIENAEDLKAIAVGYYLAEIWDQEVAKVQAGY